MRRRTMLCAALWGVMAAAAEAAGADGEQTMNVHASLSVDARHDKVLVTFKVENRGERRVGLPREIALDPEPTRRLFDLREHPGDAEVPYTGRMVKRAPLGLDDYLELAPHSAHTHTIDITRAVCLQAGHAHLRDPVCGRRAGGRAPAGIRVGPADRRGDVQPYAALNVVPANCRRRRVLPSSPRTSVVAAASTVVPAKAGIQVLHALRRARQLGSPPARGRPAAPACLPQRRRVYLSAGVLTAKPDCFR